MSKYLLDANVLITAYRFNYPMDVVPTFWEKLLEKGKEGTFALIDFIIEEVYVKEDLLKEWVKNNLDYIEILESNDPNVINSYQLLMEYVNNNNHYKQSAKDEYASSADSWLLAHAHANNYIIVTQETYDPNIKIRVKIPNICHKFGISYITTIDFLRETGIKI